MKAGFLIFAILALTLISPVFAEQSDLATYSISFKIDGMRPSGLPDGTGDRELAFVVYFPADDQEAANELFYSHLEGLLGKGETEKFRDIARQMLISD